MYLKSVIRSSYDNYRSKNYYRNDDNSNNEKVFVETNASHTVAMTATKLSSSPLRSSSKCTSQQQKQRKELQRKEQQQPPLPDYTSPPLQDAIDATPEAYRSDRVIDQYRNASASGKCSVLTNTLCHIPFEPTYSNFDTSSPVGILFYSGALVDPRSYSVLAQRITERYGLPVVVPIFANDVPFTFGQCYSGRLELAQVQFPYVQKWIFVGHSLGGLTATQDVWGLHSGSATTATNSTGTNTTANNNAPNKDAVGGLVLLAADIQPVCGPVNFSSSDIPMAIITGSNDRLFNRTRFDSHRDLVSGTNGTWFIDILGGNHHSFGSYNYSLRSSILNQSTDGEAMIPPSVQWDITVAGIYHAATRTGLTLPHPNINNNQTNCPPPTSSSSPYTCCYYCSGRNDISLLWFTTILILFQFLTRM